MKRIIPAFITLLFTAGTALADTFSVSLPIGTTVTMGDPLATLPFTITNNGPNKNIRDITFTIDTSLYNFDAGTTPPSGWCIKSFSAGSIEFALLQGGGGCSSGATASQITPGNSLTFNITVTGPNDGEIPASTSDVTTDTLSGVSVQAEGGFTRSGGLPTWTRKSLAISLTATPSSVGVGGTIVVTMNVINRSTATQSNISANPDPPSRTYGGGASVTPIGGAVYGSTSSTANPPPTTLSSNINSSMTTIPVSSTTGYSASGRIRIDNELIDYTGTTSTSFTGATRGVGGTTAVSHSSGTLVYSQDTSPFTLTPGESSTITWTFRADASGTVYFTSSATDGTGTATSKGASSNVVVIGDFTSSLSVTPLSVISGQDVTVTMTVYNNGTSALTNITPTLTPLGSATKALTSGPTPSSIASLGGGENGTFTWVYTITGSVDQTYYFSGYATSGVTNTNTSQSETGKISQYAVTVSPSTVSTGTTSITFTWTVYNAGGVTVKEVKIGISPPLTSDCSSTKGWGYQGNTPPSNWASTTTGTPVNSVTFSSNPPVDTYGIRVGESKNFSITFNCVPEVISDTTYNFSVLITDKTNKQATIDTIITVTAYWLTLTAYDEDCSTPAPASKPADGTSRYCFKASLLSGGSPVPNKTINFYITSGSGSLSQDTAITDGTGVATVYLTSPCSQSDVSTTVKAEYPPNTSDSETVQFTGIAGGNLVYVPGSFKDIATNTNPPSVSSGYNGGFTLQLRNCGTSSLTIQYTDTTLTDTTGNSFTMSSSPQTVDITQGDTGTLNFSGQVSSSSSNCYPTLTVNAGSGYTGPFSYYKDPQGDSISDPLIVSNGITCPVRIRLLDWREM